MSVDGLYKPTVLIVDADKLQRTLAKRILVRAGYEVRTAADGIRALQSILKDAPDIVLTNWHMPIMDGIELCKNVRDNEAIPFVFVILATAQDATTDGLVEAFDAGIDDFVTKPLVEHELLARLRAARRTIKLERELMKQSLQAHLANAEMEVANTSLAKANNHLDLLATTDDLTGLCNYRETICQLSRAWTVAKQTGEPLSCIMIDIDHFKKFNDTYGHHVGDLVLKETSNVLRGAARKHEIVGRIGGEEFFVICPGTSGNDSAIIAERLRDAVGRKTITHESLPLSVTISLGVAEKTSKEKNHEELQRASDKALYTAKSTGRNRVCCARENVAQPIDPDRNKADASSLPKTDAGPPLSVILVDADSESSARTRKSLQERGHTVLNPPDRTSLAEFAANQNPDVIVIDAGSEESKNVSYTHSLRCMPETYTLPIILLSSRSDGSDVLEGIIAGADDFLTKPLNADEFALRVQAIRRRHEELDASNSVRGEQTRVLGAISDFSRLLAAAGTIDEIVEHTLDATAGLLCRENVTILRPTPDGDSLAIAGKLGAANNTNEQVDVPANGSAIGRLLSGQDAFLTTTGDESSQDFCDAERDLLCRTPSVSVPLCGPGHAVGVLVVAATGYDHAVSALDLVYMDLIGNMAGAAIQDALSRQETEDAQASIVIALATLAEYRDADTGLHLDRVTRYSLLLAEKLRQEGPYCELITDQLVADLERAVVLHDIGKVAIPDRILLKPGKLTTEEFNVMKTHTTTGARTIGRLVRRTPGVSFLLAAQEIAHSHHEWINGCGYPQGLAGDDIPLVARITTVADVYDAITTRRPYKEPMSHEKAAEIIYNSSGTQFDVHIVEAFSACEGEFRSLAYELADEDAQAGEQVTVSPEHNSQ